MSKATQAQRELIERLFKRAELDPTTVTLLHKTYGVPERFVGQPVTHFLDTLTKDSASLVIATAMRVVGR